MDYTIEAVGRRISMLRTNIKAQLAILEAAEKLPERQEACRAASDDAMTAAEYLKDAGLTDLQFAVLRIHEMLAGADAYGLTAYAHYRHPVQEKKVRSIMIDLVKGAKVCLNAEIEADDDLAEAVKAYEQAE